MDGSFQVVLRPQTHQLPVVNRIWEKKRKKEKKRNDTVIRVLWAISYRICLAILSGSPRRWSKDGGLSQLSAGATIPRSHRLRAHLRDALIRFLVAPDANSTIVINSIHPLKAAARFPSSTVVSSSLFVQLWLLFRFTTSLFTADQVFPEWMTHMDIS